MKLKLILFFVHHSSVKFQDTGVQVLVRWRFNCGTLAVLLWYAGVPALGTLAFQLWYR